MERTDSDRNQHVAEENVCHIIEDSSCDEDCAIIEVHKEPTPMLEDPSGVDAEYMVPDDSMPQAVCNVEYIHESPDLYNRKNRIPPEVFGIDLEPEEQKYHYVASQSEILATQEDISIVQHDIAQPLPKEKIGLGNSKIQPDEEIEEEDNVDYESSVDEGNDDVHNDLVGNFNASEVTGENSNEEETSVAVDKQASVYHDNPETIAHDKPETSSDLEDNLLAEVIIPKRRGRKKKQDSKGNIVVKQGKLSEVLPVRRSSRSRKCSRKYAEHSFESNSDNIAEQTSEGVENSESVQRKGVERVEKIMKPSEDEVRNKSRKVMKVFGKGRKKNHQLPRKIRKRPPLVPKEDGSFECDKCDSGPFKSQRGLSRHMFSHDEFEETMRDGKYACTICNKTFARRSYLLHHRWVHGQGEFECPKCQKRFPSEREYEAHQRKSHKDAKEERHLCTTCGQSFAREISLRYHTQAHENKALLMEMDANCEITTNGNRIQVLPCLACGQKFIKTLRWLHHMKEHLNMEKLTEDMRYKISKVLEENADYMAKAKVFVCEMCGHTSYYHTGHILHMSKHTGHLPYQCKLCSKSFATERLLHSHDRGVHRRTDKYKCDECEATFMRILNFREHRLKAHGKVVPSYPNKDYSCDLCKYTTKMKARLSFHKAQVHKVKVPGYVEFPCSVCDKIFATSYAQQLHLKTHNDTRPHVCTVCGKAYNDPSNLIHHGNKQHPTHPKSLFYRPRYPVYVHTKGE